MELLRLATAGAVDDGKSTLIGRLLFDTKSIFEDQLAAVERTSRTRGDDYLDLALLTDGLRAEREQGITIDVAYRYFATPRRKFIIADTPGHVQYTRNMVTGASTANVALILVDARNGLTEQSRRHALIASLLRVPHLVLCVNKMDLVGYDPAVYQRIGDEFRAFAARLEIPDLTFIPISALSGENVVTRSERMPWYQGASLLHHLEEIHIASDRNLIDLRLPVQSVIRPMSKSHPDYRACCGQLAAGVLRLGDEVMVLPSGFTSTVSGLEVAGRAVTEVFPPMSVSVQLADKLDVGRGDMICRPRNQPAVSQDLDAVVCWMAKEPLQAGSTYLLKHTTRTVRAKVRELVYRFDVNGLHREEGAPALGLNDIGRLTLRTTLPLFHDEYRRNRTTGSFILIDESSHATVGAGMISRQSAP
jgi:bifunctional enzyme CysN/CysC